MSGDGEPLNIPPLRSCNPVLQPDSQKQELPARSRTDSDATYFKCYDNVGVHEKMLKDRVQTETYKAAVSRYQDAIAGKVVLDVGCGTGILAIFCALAGASQVYAVDESEIAFQAAEIVRANNLSDKVIVLHGRIEDILITQKVDVIISEWMGYMLLHESMLSSIIFARNKWLKRGGLILPSHAKLFMAPFTHSGRYSESIDFWKNVYGINMSSLMPLAKQCAFVDPLDERISGNNILSSPILVMEVDCYTVMVQELECVTAEFRFISTSKAPLNGFAFWFNVTFNGLKSRLPIGNPVSLQSKSDEAIVLSTAPYDAPTHWKQTLVYLYNPIELEQDQIIEGSVTLAQNKSNPRTLNIRITFTTGNQSFVKETVLRRLT